MQGIMRLQTTRSVVQSRSGSWAWYIKHFNVLRSSHCLSCFHLIFEISALEIYSQDFFLFLAFFSDLPLIAADSTLWKNYRIYADGQYIGISNAFQRPVYNLACTVWKEGPDQTLSARASFLKIQTIIVPKRLRLSLIFTPAYNITVPHHLNFSISLQKHLSSSLSPKPAISKPTPVPPLNPLTP